MKTLEARQEARDIKKEKLELEDSDMKTGEHRNVQTGSPKFAVNPKSEAEEVTSLLALPCTEEGGP